MQLVWFMIHFLYKYCKGTVFLFVVCIFIYAGNNFFKYNYLQKKEKRICNNYTVIILLHKFINMLLIENNSFLHILTDIFVFTSF